MKKIFALVILLGGLYLLPGCGDDCRVGPDIPYFDVQGFSVQNVLKSDSFLTFYEPYFLPAHPDSVVNATTYGIQLLAKLAYHSKADIHNMRPWYGSAFACEPTRSLGWKGSTETISNVIITSDSAFSAAFMAGTSLNEFFAISTHHRFGGYSDSLERKAVSLPLFLTLNPNPRPEMYLWLTQEPELSKKHRFTIKYTQTNGEEYIVQAPKAIFQ